jgi:putative FmdB family regulatory protein
MPIYEYVCQRCSHHLEVMQKINDKPLVKCPACKGKLEKIFSQTAFQFKGSGWYATDYSGKGKAPETKTDKQEKTDKNEKKEPATATGGA